MNHAKAAQDTPDTPAYPPEYNPFDEVEFLPGLGAAVLWVVAAFAFVHLMLLSVQTV